MTSAVKAALLVERRVSRMKADDAKGTTKELVLAVMLERRVSRTKAGVTLVTTRSSARARRLERTSSIASSHAGRAGVAAVGEQPPSLVAACRTPRRETGAGKPSLLSRAAALYPVPMIAVKAENDRLQVTIPTEGMSPDEVNDFVSWLRVESVVRRSRLTPGAAWKLSEVIKSDWWQANEGRFAPEAAQ
jgi:hypothetical protein